MVLNIIGLSLFLPCVFWNGLCYLGSELINVNI